MKSRDSEDEAIKNTFPGIPFLSVLTIVVSTDFLRSVTRQLLFLRFSEGV
ncbi:hypothetical protein HMPREF1152_0562 [Mogibacterium sp. CM50]|nr:hypothetical protein HMPREF1152_0562 [Mogibacterium sp. CM50]